MRDFNPKSKFRTAVIVRDSPGQATDVMYTYCTACHIVRLSCRDVSLATQQVRQKADSIGSSGRDGHNVRPACIRAPSVDRCFATTCVMRMIVLHGHGTNKWVDFTAEQLRGSPASPNRMGCTLLRTA